MNLQDKLDAGWALARKNFGQEITFYAPALRHFETDEMSNHGPARFAPVSITGKSCALHCEHCKGQLLRDMNAAPTPEALFEVATRLAKRGAEGLLVSGGADPAGVVPLIPFADTLERCREELGLLIAVHTGLIDAPTVEALARAGIAAAMVDIIGARETFREIYHLEKARPEDCLESLQLLHEAGIPSVPHVVIGLHFGELRGEARALEMVAQVPTEALVLVVLDPKLAARMPQVRPPAVELVAEVVADARLAMADRPILMGCAKPGGRYQREVDRLAVEAGLNGIAFPAPGTITYARERGLEVKTSELCCSMEGFLPVLEDLGRAF